jgi:hypothetical protein
MWWVLRLVAAGPRGLTSQALVVAGDSRLEEVTR